MGCVFHIHCSVFKDQPRFRSGRRLFYQIFILLSSTFLNFFNFSFSVLGRLITSENYYTKQDPACQRFSSKTFAVNLFDILFFVSFHQAQLIIIHAFQRMSTPFFNFLFCFLRPPFSYLFIIEKRPAAPAGLSTSSIIMLSFLLRSQPVSFLPFWKRTVYKQHHL